MSKKDEKIKTAEEVGYDIIAAMDEEFHNQSDRVVAVLGGAYLDDVIENLLRAVFIREGEVADSLLRPDAGLGSHGSRCQLAFCLGLIRKHQYDDLKQVAKIRNRFAHNYKSLSFDESPIRDWCAALQQPKLFESMPNKLFTGQARKKMIAYVKGINVTPRQKFETTIYCLFGSILRRVKFVSQMDESKWFSQNPDRDTP
jgi:DNA-binding MltR family transcriptional regulator